MLPENPNPKSYMPFGGGYRRCVGAAFAMIELKVMLNVMLDRVDFASIHGSGTEYDASGFVTHPQNQEPMRVVSVCPFVE